MTDLVSFLADFVFRILLIPALVVLAFLTLYLPSLIITRGLYYFRRKQGPAMRFLSRPIGPIPGRGADRSALRRALTLWAMLGLKTVSCATTLLIIGSGYALFGVAVEGWVEIAFYAVMFTAFFAAVVSGAECVFLLVRLALHAPRNANSQLLPGNLESPDDRGNQTGGTRPPLSRVRLAVRRAGWV
ncbi:MAG TPA: hypothetical protein VFO21_00615 [Vicinamibacterales bacterium]|nr:hypothetical protein [Vicinamibacterales bacterium]